MLDRGAADVQAGVAGGFDIRRLSAQTLVLIWDVPTRLWTSPQLEAVEGKLPAPMVTLRLPLASGGTRLLWALRAPQDAGLRLHAYAGALSSGAEVAIEPDTRFGALDVDALLDDLTPASRLSLASRMLQGWPGLFGLHRSRTFTGLIHRFVASLVETPAAVRAVARIGDDRLVMETALPATFGKIDDVFVVAPNGFARLGDTPHLSGTDSQGRRAMHLVMDRAMLRDDGFVVVAGAQGLAVRRMAQARQVPDLPAWWRQRATMGSGLYEHIVAALARGTDSDARAALEFQLRCPLQPQRVTGGNGLPAAEIDVALSGPSGLFAGGWFSDPTDLVDGLDVLDGDGGYRPLDGNMHRFRGHANRDGETVEATGFVAFLDTDEGAAPLLQPRFLLRLASGARYLMVPPRQPVDPSEARASALRAIPPQHLHDGVLTGCLAPTLGALQDQHRARVGIDAVKTIGQPPDNPEISIVVPLYRVLDFLRVQVASFAADPDIAERGELVYVLDSPEQAEEVEHLMHGLHLLYGLPMTLVVMNRNGGYSLACNAGARTARGHVLAMLNSDVIPSGPGWLATLAARLEGDDGVAAVGPKLLFEDGSIQHAGMYFARDFRGQWLNHHFYKGMPGRFAPACVDRMVPAVTGACLVAPRAVFEDVGGFTEDYVIGDYEDSDLCLKIRREGHGIAYAANVELYHLERRSIQHNADYMRGVAARYNAWLHAGRWNDAMSGLMGEDGAGGVDPARWAA